MLKLIGLTGKAGAGKDTVRDILENDFDFQGAAFADPIRSMLYGLCAHAQHHADEYINLHELKETLIPVIDASYRELAQTLGTEWGRAMFPGLWVRIVAEKIHAKQDCSFVISDVRFPDEAQFIRENGGEIWRIERSTEPVRDHESERHDIQASRVICNTGSVDDLFLTVSDCLSKP